MEVDAPSSRVGYNTKLFENSQAIKKFTCVICNNVLRDAVQIPQSVDPKRACSDCYKNNIRDGVCPIFKTHDTRSYPDKFADREIKDLTIVCENKENGCTWSDRLGNYEFHIPICQYKRILCEHCQQLVVLQGHEKGCPNIPISCPACSVMVLRKDMMDHNLICQMQYQICDCGEQILPNELGTKLLTHWQHQRRCLYSYVGCFRGCIYSNAVTNSDVKRCNKIIDKCCKTERWRGELNL